MRLSLSSASYGWRILVRGNGVVSTLRVDTLSWIYNRQPWSCARHQELVDYSSDEQARVRRLLARNYSSSTGIDKSPTEIQRTRDPPKSQ